MTVSDGRSNISISIHKKNHYIVYFRGCRKENRVRARYSSIDESILRGKYGVPCDHTVVPFRSELSWMSSEDLVPLLLHQQKVRKIIHVCNH